MYGCAGSSLLHTDFFLKVASSGHSTVAVCELLLLKSTDSSVQRLQELWHTGSRVQPGIFLTIKGERYVV